MLLAANSLRSLLGCYGAMDEHDRPLQTIVKDVHELLQLLGSDIPGCPRLIAIGGVGRAPLLVVSAGLPLPIATAAGGISHRSPVWPCAEYVTVVELAAVKVADVAAGGGMAGLARIGGTVDLMKH